MDRGNEGPRVGNGAILEALLSGSLGTRGQDGQRELGRMCGKWG